MQESFCLGHVGQHLSPLPGLLPTAMPCPRRLPGAGLIDDNPSTSYSTITIPLFEFLQVLSTTAKEKWYVEMESG